MSDAGIINEGEDVFTSVTFQRSATIGRLMGALAKAQGGFVTVRKGNLATVEPKDGGQSYTYRYAELADFLEACRKPLSEAGLAVTQPAHLQGTVVTVETTLWHESGEWMSNVFSLVAASPAPQKVGSALTFARRYAFCALVNIAAEKEDDDGKLGQTPDAAAPAGQRRQEERPRTQGRRRPTAELITLRDDCRRVSAELEAELVTVVEAAGGNWSALPEDVGGLWSAGWRAVGDRLKAARKQAPRTEAQTSQQAAPASDTAPPKRGPKWLHRLREDSRRAGCERELIAAVEAAGGDWAALPDDCTRFFDAAWRAVGERVKAAQAAGLGGAETHKTPEAVASKVDEITRGMRMPGANAPG